MAEGAFVAYYRVSTERQGRSGLGLAAQRKAVEDFLNGGNWRLVAEFTEVESGKQADRPALAKTLQACRLQRAKLVIAKKTAPTFSSGSTKDASARPNRCARTSWCSSIASRRCLPPRMQGSLP
jgi:DNA invertase Pin-like site-specific DNA recombinase